MHRIKDWAEDDRPREKLIKSGERQLSNAELLAILIGTGTRELSALDAGKQVLRSVDNRLDILAQCSVNDLRKLRGIGNAKAVTIIAAMELARRRETVRSDISQKVRSSVDSYELLLPCFLDLIHEEFRVLYLSRANVVIANQCISQGGISGTVADGKIIFKRALQLNASAMILAHNHPSGEVAPSDSDKVLTKQLVKFGECIDLKVLDHLIITENNYFSFADEGLI